MNTDPVVWHYGLVARWWAEFNTGGPEIEYFKALIERFGQPALDVACGTGRLLIPFLQAGLEVDGADISPDMLRLCAEKAHKYSLAPRLFNQPIHALDLPRTYRSVVMCGVFGLGGSRQHDQGALKRIYDLLEPGGALLLDNYTPYKDPDEWLYWGKAERQNLPEPWPTGGERRRAENGDELQLQGRLAALDPLDQTATREMRAMLWQGGQLVRQEQYTLIERLYFRNEILDMLARAGFQDVEVQGDYTPEPAAPDTGILVFIARK